MKKFFKGLYMGILLFFLYAPILTMVVLSFNAGKSRGNFTGFSLRWYAELFQNQQIMGALKNTVLIAVLATVIATVIGTIATVGIFAMKRRSQDFVLNVTYLPIVNPDIVTGISLMILYLFLKLDMGFLTMLLSHLAFDIPYVIFAVLPRLQQMDHHMYEAALDLGASPIVALWRVILPEIAPGVITGAIMAFTMSIDDFVISYFTSSGVQNLSIYVFTSAKRGLEPTVYALSTLLFVVVLSLLLVINRRTRRDEKSNKQIERI